MARLVRVLLAAAAIVFGTVATVTFHQGSASLQAQPAANGPFDSSISQNAQRMIEEGRGIFRYDTFGDEAFWGDQLKLHQAIAGQKLGGVGPGLSPKMALNLGLKVDADALPSDLVTQIKAGKVDMDDLAPYTKLLGKDAETIRTVLRSWGPGKYDAELVQDGKAMRPDGKSAATLLPAAFGLAGVNLHTYSGWGSVTHWNAYVANTQLHGKGVFFDPRLDDKDRFPVGAKAGFGNMRSNPDLVTSALAALDFYQLAIPAPSPPA